jgi:hypothetical protein
MALGVVVGAEVDVVNPLALPPGDVEGGGGRGDPLGAHGAGVAWELGHRYAPVVWPVMAWPIHSPQGGQTTKPRVVVSSLSTTETERVPQRQQVTGRGDSPGSKRGMKPLVSRVAS